MRYTKFKWEHETQTVRTDPGNHCVCCVQKFTEGGSTDGALLPDGPDELGRLLACAPEMMGALKEASRTLAEVSTKTGMSFFSVGGLIDDVIAKVEGRKEVMRKLDRLKREAMESCTFRGHSMNPWADAEDGKSSATDCCACGKIVHVATNPAPNDIAVGGEAVALSCGENES